MTREKTRSMLGVVLSLLVVAVCMTGSFRWLFFPAQMTLLKGQTSLSWVLP